MVQQVAEYAERHGMFPPGSRVGVAVSGGADSVCLLHVLFEMAPRWNLRLEVLHLDHGLRGDASKQDAEFTAALARSLGLPFHLERAGKLVGNLEEAGREARRAFFLRFLHGGLLQRIALAHTRNDQAETVLFRLLRGAGPTGLAAMRPVTPEGFVRPLLETGREEVEAFLRERGIPWREDITNVDLAFARNRIRHDLMPKLIEEWNPALIQTLCRTAELAAEEEKYWETVVDEAFAGLFHSDQPGLILRCRPFAGLPRALARRLLRKAVGKVKGNLRGVEFGHVEDLLALATASVGSGRVALPGVEAVRSFDQLRLAPPAGGARDWEILLTAPAVIALEGGKSLLRIEILSQSGYTEEGGGNDLDGFRIEGPLQLRNWRPGDRYQPVGRTHPEKVKTLFQKARIPVWERRNWPVMTMAGRILWVRQFGAAAEFAARAGCGKVLRICEEPVGQ